MIPAWADGGTAGIANRQTLCKTHNRAVVNYHSFVNKANGRNVF